MVFVVGAREVGMRQSVGVGQAVFVGGGFADFLPVRIIEKHVHIFDGLARFEVGQPDEGFAFGGLEGQVVAGDDDGRGLQEIGIRKRLRLQAEEVIANRKRIAAFILQTEFDALGLIRFHIEVRLPGADRLAFRREVLGGDVAALEAEELVRGQGVQGDLGGFEIGVFKEETLVAIESVDQRLRNDEIGVRIQRARLEIP